MTRALVLALLLVGCTSHADAPAPSATCAPRMFVLSVDLSRCNWREVDAGDWRCDWDGGS